MATKFNSICKQFILSTTFGATSVNTVICYIEAVPLYVKIPLAVVLGIVFGAGMAYRSYKTITLQEDQVRAQNQKQRERANEQADVSDTLSLDVRYLVQGKTHIESSQQCVALLLNNEDLLQEILINQEFGNAIVRLGYVLKPAHEKLRISERESMDSSTSCSQTVHSSVNRTPKHLEEKISPLTVSPVNLSGSDFGDVVLPPSVPLGHYHTAPTGATTTVNDLLARPHYLKKPMPSAYTATLSSPAENPDVASPATFLRVLKQGVPATLESNTRLYTIESSISQQSRLEREHHQQKEASGQNTYSGHHVQRDGEYSGRRQLSSHALEDVEPTTPQARLQWRPEPTNQIRPNASFLTSGSSRTILTQPYPMGRSASEHSPKRYA